MIKRKGYPDSRWGREYRLTDSQVAAIQARLASETLATFHDGQHPGTRTAAKPRFVGGRAGHPANPHTARRSRTDTGSKHR